MPVAFLGVLALSAVVAMLYNFAQPRFFALQGLQKYESSYFGKTALTTVVIFGAIVVTLFLFSRLEVEL